MPLALRFVLLDAREFPRGEVFPGCMTLRGAALDRSRTADHHRNELGYHSALAEYMEDS